jgi:hypothetical protein
MRHSTDRLLLCGAGVIILFGTWESTRRRHHEEVVEL